MGIPAEVLRRRPDVRRAERELAAQTAKVGVAVADLYPKLTLIGTVGLESLDSGDFLESASRVFNVGPSVEWNIFSAGRVRKNIVIQNEKQKQALIAYEATILNALKDVEDALVSYGKEMVRRDSLMLSRSRHREERQDCARSLPQRRDQFSNRPRRPALPFPSPGSTHPKQRQSDHQHHHALQSSRWRLAITAL